MKLLNIFRSEPDDTVKTLCESLSGKNQCDEIRLYEGDVDWEKLVDDIFSHDKVVCWW